MTSGKSLVKGIGIGIVAGSLIAAAVIPMDKKAHHRKNHALKRIGHVVEGICDAFS